MSNSWHEGEIIYQNKWSRIFLNSFKHKDKIKEIYTVDFGKRSAVILYRDNKILFVKQHRILINRTSLELPGGKIENNESFEQGAVRECLEETGYQCETLKEIAFFHPGLDTLNNPTKIFMTDDFAEDVRTNIESEVEGVEWIDIEKVHNMLDLKQFPDALTQLGLLYFFRSRS